MRGDAVAPGEQAKSPVMEGGYVRGFLGSAKLSYVDILRGLFLAVFYSVRDERRCVCFSYGATPALAGKR